MGKVVANPALHVTILIITSVVLLVRLALFSLAILPGIIRLIWYWNRSKSILRNVQYGPSCRNFLDIYLPIESEGNQYESNEQADQLDEHTTLKSSDGNSCSYNAARVKSTDRNGSQIPRTKGYPVFIFINGGAWIVGHKTWGVLLGWALQQRGILVVTPDYRNYPQSKVDGMVGDVHLATGWVLDHIQEYGGDPQKVFLSGQSAGAQLAMMALLGTVPEGTNMHQEIATDPAEVWGSKRWKPSDIRGFIGIGSPFDMTDIIPAARRPPHGFGSRGESVCLFSPPVVCSAVVHSAMGEDLARWSPLVLLQRAARAAGVPWPEPESPRESSPFRATVPKSSLDEVRTMHLALPGGGGGGGDTVDLSAGAGLDTLDVLGDCCCPEQTPSAPAAMAAVLGAGFPPVSLFHGTADTTSPVAHSTDFARILSAVGGQVSVKYYEGWSHTDPIIEAPMAGKDIISDEIALNVHNILSSSKTQMFHSKKGDTVENTQENTHSIAMSKTNPDKPVKSESICPQFMIHFARLIAPL